MSEELTRLEERVQELRRSGHESDARRHEAETLPAYRKAKALALAVEQSARNALACVTQLEAPLDSIFDQWAGVKKGLLGMNFEKLVPDGQYREPTQGLARAHARVLQLRQEEVHKVLTDVGQRDAAYRLALGCEEAKCSRWASAASAAGFVTRTPVLSAVAKTISGGLVFHRNSSEGVGFWDSVKETLIEVSPFQLASSLLDTEVRAIERGEARPYRSP